MSKKKTHTEFIHQLRGRGMAVLGIYRDSSTPLWFRCDTCKCKWRATPNNVLSKGSGCPDCARERVARGRRGDNDWFTNGNGDAVIDISTPTYIDVAMLMDRDEWIKLLENPLAGRVSAVKYGGQKELYAEVVVDGRRTTVHRYLMNFPQMVDHVNRDRLDNRKVNLRACTPSQNCMNKTRANNTSGRVGVRKVSWGWQARIKVDRNEISLGSFSTFDEAVKAREDAEKKYFGEYA